MPVFNRPPVNECDSTVMRPSDDALPLPGQQAIASSEDYLIPNMNPGGRKAGNLPWLPGGCSQQPAAPATAPPAAAAEADAARDMPVISEEESALWPSAGAHALHLPPPAAFAGVSERGPAVPTENAPPAPNGDMVRNGPVPYAPAPLDVNALRNRKSGYVNVGVKDQSGTNLDSGVQPAGSVLPGSITC